MPTSMAHISSINTSYFNVLIVDRCLFQWHCYQMSTLMTSFQDAHFICRLSTLMNYHQLCYQMVESLSKFTGHAEIISLLISVNRASFSSKHTTTA